jgi:hypothetical protein
VSRLHGASHDRDDDSTPDDPDVSWYGRLPRGGIGLDVLRIAKAGATSAQARPLRAKLTNVCGKRRSRLNAACIQVPSDSLASAAPATVS